MYDPGITRASEMTTVNRNPVKISVLENSDNPKEGWHLKGGA